MAEREGLACAFGAAPLAHSYAARRSNRLAVHDLAFAGFRLARQWCSRLTVQPWRPAGAAAWAGTKGEASGERGMDSDRLWPILGPAARRRLRAGVQNAGAFCRTKAPNLQLTRPEKAKGPMKGPFAFSGGERGIRTLDTLLTYTPLAGERFRPLSHLSEISFSFHCAGPATGRHSGTGARGLTSALPSATGRTWY